MKNLNFVGGLVKNPSASISATTTQIMQKHLDLSQTNESIYSDEPVTPFRDFLAEDYNPFQKDPEVVHSEESSASGDVASNLSTQNIVNNG